MGFCSAAEGFRVRSDKLLLKSAGIWFVVVGLHVEVTMRPARRNQFYVDGMLAEVSLKLV